VSSFGVCSTARNNALPGENAPARIAQPNLPDTLFAAVAQRNRISPDLTLARA
jgi:hypothetical protein